MIEPDDAADGVESGDRAGPTDGELGCGCCAKLGLVGVVTLGVLDMVRNGRGERVVPTDPAVLAQIAAVLVSCVLCVILVVWGAYLFLDALVLQRSRAPVLRAARLAGLFGLVAAVGVAGLYGAGIAQRMAFDRAERAAARIHAAIEAFHAQHGVPPRSLDELIPAYLENVPPTTLESAPRFEYDPHDDGGRLFIRWGSDRWEV
ncbi:MAG: hypothetical protein AAGB93_11095 [Planctomycetota bacterium]